MVAWADLVVVPVSYFRVAVALRRPRAACRRARRPAFVRISETRVVPVSRDVSAVLATVTVAFLVLCLVPCPALVLVTAVSVSLPRHGALAQRMLSLKARCLDTDTVCLAIESLP